jgi:hypothetical protein
MRTIVKIAPALLLAAVVSACTTARAPLADVPAGNYVMVEPASDVYNAASIHETGYTLRVGDDVWSGQHWVDSQGRLHMVDDEGPCMGQGSIWTYSYTGNRVTLDLIEDRCTARPMTLPERMVYERR